MQVFLYNGRKTEVGHAAA